MTPKKKKPATGKKRGAPKGNQNSRKHGLWAKNSPTPAEGKGAKWRRDVMDEVIDRLFNKFSTLQDLDQITKCANSLSVAVTAANSCDRTIAILEGKTTSLSAAIEALLANEDPNDERTLE